jgi:putative ABC transport system permease protein
VGRSDGCFLGESAVLGLIGSVVGVVFGVLIARAIASSIAGMISDLYGVAQRADDVAATPSLLILALGIGVVASVVAAAIPAWNAARVDPVQALQKGKYQVLSAGESRSRAALAAIFGLISAGCLMAPGSRPVFYFGMYRPSSSRCCSRRSSLLDSRERFARR